MEGKTVSFCINYMVCRSSSVVNVTRTANLTLDWDTNFKSFSKFIDELEKAFACYKFCAKNGICCSVELSCVKYHTEDAHFVTDKCDIWKFNGCPEVNPTGIHLDPDPNYTKEYHDIWVDFQDDIIKMLADIGV